MEHNSTEKGEKPGLIRFSVDQFSVCGAYLQASIKIYKYFIHVVPGENELFQSYPCSFLDLTLCTACLLLQYY